MVTEAKTKGKAPVAELDAVDLAVAFNQAKNDLDRALEIFSPYKSVHLKVAIDLVAKTREELERIDAAVRSLA